MNHKALGESWDDYKKEIFTPEELAASNLRVALITAMIDAREKEGLSQRDIEKLSGVRQPVLSRLESGESNPRLSTVPKVLAPLGKTLAVVPLNQAEA